MNQKLRSQQLRQEIIGTISDKKHLYKQEKYTAEKQNLAAMSLKISQERHTRHLKRDEVAKNTHKL